VEFETSRGCPTASYFLLLVQKKVTKVNDTPYHGLQASLRYSTIQATAELAALKQSSPKTPDSSALLGMVAGD
jgi:hypothetical protein